MKIQTWLNYSSVGSCIKERLSAYQLESERNFVDISTRHSSLLQGKSEISANTCDFTATHVTTELLYYNWRIDWFSRELKAGEWRVNNYSCKYLGCIPNG